MSKDLAIMVASVAALGFVAGAVRGWNVVAGISLLVLVGVWAMKAPMGDKKTPEQTPGRAPEGE